MSERDWKSEEEQRREEKLKAIETYFGSIRKKQDHLIFTTPNPPNVILKKWMYSELGWLIMDRGHKMKKWGRIT